MACIATSRSGNWTDRIELRRITFVMQHTTAHKPADKADSFAWQPDQ